jgi:hypothetical protein
MFLKSFSHLCILDSLLFSVHKERILRIRRNQAKASINLENPTVGSAYFIEDSTSNTRQSGVGSGSSRPDPVMKRVIIADTIEELPEDIQRSVGRCSS